MRLSARTALLHRRPVNHRLVMGVFWVDESSLAWAALAEG
jgi:hypothetical protein